MKNKKFIGLALLSVLLLTACDDIGLDQVPPKNIEKNALTDFTGVLNAAYHYQTGSVTPLAIMGDFRADNMLMEEEPFPAFNRYNPDLAGLDLVEQFFRPFYSNLYKAILSANTVIEKSSDQDQIAEAQFLRALSYFKLVMVFGDVPVNLVAEPNISDTSILIRQPVADIYNNIIIPDFRAAIASLDNSGLATSHATQIAARAFLGKVYMHLGNYSLAATEFALVVNGASAARIRLETVFANVVRDGNTEIIFGTIRSTSVPDEYGFTEFPEWFAGADTKSPTPLNPRLSAAFDAAFLAGGGTGTDIRKAGTISLVNRTGGSKYKGALEQDWIEIRLSDVILMYAEALNETSSPAATTLALLNPIRTRAGLNSLVGTATTQAEVRQAIANERRLELALEGHRWFDLVRTGTVDAEMGIAVNSNYYIFPIPNSEILASNGVIGQNPGY